NKNHFVLGPAGPPFFRESQGRWRSGREPIEHHETDIVPCALILATGVPKARDPTNSGFVHSRLGAGREKLFLRFLLLCRRLLGGRCPTLCRLLLRRDDFRRSRSFFG